MSEPALLLSEEAWDAITCAASTAHPLETGGILIGVYVDSIPWVTQAVELASPDRGRSHYRLPAGATQPAVKAARAFDSRLGYLGDWHSHPADANPSTLDFASLALVSYRRPRRPNPTMIVARRRSGDYAIDARRIVGMHVCSCEIRIAGSLPRNRGEN